MAEHPACSPLSVPCAPQHLLKCSFDVVKRWVNEAQEAASSDNIMVQVSRAVILKVLRLVACPGQTAWTRTTETLAAPGWSRLSSFCRGGETWGVWGKNPGHHLQGELG